VVFLVLVNENFTVFSCVRGGLLILVRAFIFFDGLAHTFNFLSARGVETKHLMAESSRVFFFLQTLIDAPQHLIYLFSHVAKYRRKMLSLFSQAVK
jgi:hypothetical protein